MFQSNFQFKYSRIINKYFNFYLSLNSFPAHEERHFKNVVLYSQIFLPKNKRYLYKLKKSKIPNVLN